MMQRALHLLAAATVAGASLGANEGHAQQASPAPQRTLYNSEQVPREFVIAMLESQFGAGGAPDLVIGDAPGPLKAKIVLPPGSRILGSTLTIASSSVFVEVPARSDTLAAAIWRELPKLGWTRAEMSLYSGGGFRPQQSSVLAPSMWCGATDALTFMMVPRLNGSTLVRYNVQDRQASICNRRPSENVQVVQMQRSTLPTLYIPTGTDLFAPACMNAGSGSRGSNATMASVRTSVSSQDLMDAFGRQLADSGWTPASSESGTLSKVFTRKETDGTVRRTTLIIAQRPGGRADCRDLRMEVEADR